MPNRAQLHEALPCAVSRGLTPLHIHNLKPTVEAVIAWPKSADSDELAAFLKMLQEYLFCNRIVQNMKSSGPFPSADYRETFLDSLAVATLAGSGDEEPLARYVVFFDAERNWLNHEHASLKVLREG